MNQHKSIKKLKLRAQYYVNRYIKLRDTRPNGIGSCISCGKVIQFGLASTHASHLYSVGSYPSLRFNEDNIWASCLRCNYFLSGNLNEYRKRLIDKIGEERVNALDIKADYSKRTKLKWWAIDLEQIIEKYKAKCKELEA